MRKTFTFIMLAAMLFLVACGMLDKKTAGDVIVESIEATQELMSYTMDMEIETKVDDVKILMELSGDVTHEPEAVHMNMSMGIPGMSMDFEIYMVDETMYMNVFGQWVKAEDEEFQFDELDQLNENDLEKYKQFAETFEMTEEDDVYVLKLSESGDEFAEILKPFLEASMQDMGEDTGFDEDFLEEILEDIDVKEIELELHIDKETMFVTKQTLESTMEVDGETLELKVEATLSNFNEIDPIEVPKDVIENAIDEDDLDDFDLGFDFEDDFDFDEEEDFNLDFVFESMTFEEIREAVNFAIPELTYIPEGYELIDSIYYADDEMEMVYAVYDKGGTDSITYSIYPFIDNYLAEYGIDFRDAYVDDWTELVTINGNDGVLEKLDDDFIFLTWELDDGLILELLGEGTDVSKEFLIEIAEGIQ